MSVRVHLARKNDKIAVNWKLTFVGFVHNDGSLIWCTHNNSPPSKDQA